MFNIAPTTLQKASKKAQKEKLTHCSKLLLSPLSQVFFFTLKCTVKLISLTLLTKIITE